MLTSILLIICTLYSVKSQTKQELIQNIKNAYENRSIFVDIEYSLFIKDTLYDKTTGTFLSKGNKYKYTKGQDISIQDDNYLIRIQPQQKRIYISDAVGINTILPTSGIDSLQKKAIDELTYNIKDNYYELLSKGKLRGKFIVIKYEIDKRTYFIKKIIIYDTHNIKDKIKIEINYKTKYQSTIGTDFSTKRVVKVTGEKLELTEKYSSYELINLIKH